jgi:hypothetical protein
MHMHSKDGNSSNKSWVKATVTNVLQHQPHCQLILFGTAKPSTSGLPAATPSVPSVVLQAFLQACVTSLHQHFLHKHVKYTHKHSLHQHFLHKHVKYTQKHSLHQHFLHKHVKYTHKHSLHQHFLHKHPLHKQCEQQAFTFSKFMQVRRRVRRLTRLRGRSASPGRPVTASTTWAAHWQA